MKDVTDRKEMDAKKEQLEKELQRIGKLDAMATMASGIAHDFNNLLTIINGNVEMARILSLDKQVQQLLVETGKALQLTTGLIRRFSTFSDNYLPSKSLVRVDELLSDLLENELSGTNVSFQLTSDEHLPCVDLDAGLMAQVFQNILLNSVEAMKGEGRLTVDMAEISSEKENKHIKQSLPDGKFIRINIYDTGCGIDDKVMDRVFDAYFSTKQKGTQKGMGLGLTIAHAIVKKHGGVLRLDASPGDGCTATIYLPVGRKVKIGDDDFDNEEQRHVLIMDDDELMRIIFAKMFEQFNCQVTTADNGEQAIHKFKTELTSSHPHDLVLLDLQVEKGMNGADAAQQLHNLSAGTPLVAMGEDGGEEVMLNFHDYHFVSAVEKPFSVDTVESLLNTYAGKHMK
jgi:nitrogen-specific signal transduction histidine kinase/CheY-like chemotaxis protein